MELPCRDRGDQLLKPGELTGIRERLRAIAPRHDLVTVIACAFDHRTRMLPFVYADVRMAPAGARAIGSALVDAGFHKTRIVLEQWNPNFRPSRMRLDGRVPDLFLVSSMSLHAAPCEALIRDARRIDPARRPLIIVGGSIGVYEPWKVFHADPQNPGGADVAVTGEEYVLLQLLEVLLAERTEREPLRKTFGRVRDAGLLDAIPGLVYPRGDRDGVAEELVDTGVQRLIGDLDELPHPVLGYRLLEPPGSGRELASQALGAENVRAHSRVASLVVTFGCRFHCEYCPIPAYNQGHLRSKSGERIADEMRRLHAEYGLRYFFGTDDNFFHDSRRAFRILETLARTEVGSFKLRRSIRWGTEVTVHDTLRMKDHLPLAHTAGVRAFWMGVEDMTGTLVRKGQNANQTVEAFQALRAGGICPMPMMMHHDGQPLYTRGSLYGLLNQVRLLRRSGAVSVQVLMITPSAGSKLYVPTFTSGVVYDRVAGRRVEDHMFDGNYVIASGDADPWRKQLNLMASYLYFYNPLRLVVSLLGPKGSLRLKPAGMQLVGMYGLAQTIRRTLGWAFRLMLGTIRRTHRPPASAIPMRAPDGGPASHALPGTPAPKSPPVPAKAPPARTGGQGPFGGAGPR